MIALVSILLASWEAIALTTHRPTITTLSTRRGTEVLVWGWFLCLGLHFIDERNKSGGPHRKGGRESSERDLGSRKAVGASRDALREQPRSN